MRHERDAGEDARPRLGRGLAALMGEMAPAQGEAGHGQMRVAVEFLRANPRNPRRQFDAAAMEDLVASVRQKGVLQPILVRAIPKVADAYEIVAGERRWRAAQAARLVDVPVAVIDVDDKQALEIAIVENVQRADLNPMDEAEGYRQLADTFGYTQSALAEVIGKSRSHVANTMRLNGLPDDVRALVLDGSLSAGHARALLTVPNASTLARRIVAENLSVRQVEDLGRAEKATPAKRRGKAPTTLELQTTLSGDLGLSVTIDEREGRGAVHIRFETPAELERLCDLLRGRT